MRLLRTLVPGLLAILMVSFAAVPIAAQDTSAEASELDDIDGLQLAYARSFTPDFMAMFEVATPDAESSGWLVLTTMALEFDSEDSASAAVETLLEDLAMEDLSEDEDIRIEETTLDADFDHVAQLTIFEDEGVATNILFAATQDSTYLYVVFGMVGGDDPAPAAAAMLTTMRDADAEGGEGTFSEDGTSEGGLWDKLPTLEQAQAEVPAFVEATDEIAFPESGATPAA